MPEVGVAPGLVERRPHGDRVAEFARHQLGVVAEPAHRVAVAEPPMSSRPCGRSQWNRVGHGHDVACEQRLDQPVVERDALGVDLAAALGHHPRPRDREAVRLQAEVGHHRHVVLDAVVVVARDVAGVTLGDLALGVRERVPHAPAAAALAGAALDLVAAVAAPHRKPAGKVIAGRSLIGARVCQVSSLMPPAADRTSTRTTNVCCGMRGSAHLPAYTPVTTAGTIVRFQSSVSPVKNVPPAVSAPSAR
jgi:hypothetical protein